MSMYSFVFFVSFVLGFVCASGKGYLPYHGHIDKFPNLPMASSLPSSYDIRNVNGQNYGSRVINQRRYVFLFLSHSLFSFSSPSKSQCLWILLGNGSNRCIVRSICIGIWRCSSYSALPTNSSQLQ
jgi:hypothetical protein